MLELGTDHVFLDATGLEQFDQRFPNIAASLRAVDLDPAKDWLPVAPAAHYTCGGIVTDLQGASSLPGLWAAGEASCSGVHGANRLASNSLLEGMVFGPRAVEAIEAGVAGPEASGAMRTVMGIDPDQPDVVPGDVIGGRFVHLDPVEPAASRSDVPTAHDDPATIRAELQHQLTQLAGVLRDAVTLAEATAVVRAVLAVPRGDTVAAHELHNLATVGRAVVDAAQRRQESRGAHTRDDFPRTDPAFSVRLVYA
jgi:L-aspartate oxidase